MIRAMQLPPNRALANRSPVQRPSVVELLRDWRSRRRRSQMDLALDVGVSTRHLSCIETGRARPSPAMLEAIAGALDVPLRERNRLMLAAGYAPRYAARTLDDASMRQVRTALDRLLRAHEPYPGLVLDLQWNVVLANRPAQWLAGMLPPELTRPALNVFRASLHPRGLAALTENFADWAAYLLATLRRAVTTSADAGLAAIQQEVLAYPNVAALGPAGTSANAPAEAPLLVPCVLRLPQGRLSMFTTLTTFGTPRDITLDELCVELFYPADDAAEALLRVIAGSADEPSR